MSVALSAEQEELKRSFARFFAAEAGADRVREAEPLGFDGSLWVKLCGLEAVSMALPEPDVDPPVAAAGLTDLAIVCEEHGRSLAPVPLVESIVAARVLQRGDAHHLVEGIAEGTTLATLMLRPVEGGHARLVPAGAIADVVIGLDGDELAVWHDPPDLPYATLSTLGCTPVADRLLRGERRSLARGEEALAHYATARDEWLILAAASLVGMADGALALGTRYVTERHQFGRPIGSFQTVSHRLADVATSVDGARLLVHEAAATADGEPDELGVVASMAFAFATETARQATTACLHFHGGYGYMLEYDIQLYFRRAMAWTLLGGGVRSCHRRVAASLSSPEQLTMPGETAVNVAAFRAEARSFVAEHVTSEVLETAYRTGTLHSWPLHRALGARGWLTAAWPLADGGQGRDPVEMLVLQEELQRVGAPVDGWTISMSAADPIRVLGSPELQAEVLPDFIAGDAIISLGFSEPDAGSDVAAVRTRAVLDGDTWIINGQKMFTTLAHEARWIFLLARTNPDAPKHKGLTVFLVPTDADGFSLQPIHTLGGERTNITFFNDVHIPDRYRVGDVDGGWTVLTTALNLERGSATGPGPVFVGTFRHMLDTTMRWAEQHTERCESRLIDDPIVSDQLARASIDLAVADLLSHRAVAAAATSDRPEVEAAMSKLFSTEAIQRWAPVFLELCDVEGLLQPGAGGAAMGGEIEHLYRHSVVTTIYGGSSEVLRGIIARRRLELPE